jgi:hypothetical protein
MQSCDPLLDNSILVVTIVVALVARLLLEFFPEIGIRFGFGSFGFRIGMAGPVIANALQNRKN